MKYIITENKLEKTVIHFLNKGYGNLTINGEIRPNTIFFVDGKNVLMVYDIRNSRLWVDNSLYETLLEWFNLGYRKTKDIIEKWAFEKYGIKSDKEIEFGDTIEVYKGYF